MSNNNQTMTNPTFSQSKKIHNVNELPCIIDEFLLHSETITTNKNIEYFNVPCAFDIETTSFYEKGEKRAIMYEWTLGLNGAVIIGRTWKDFVDAIDMIATTLELSTERRLIIYVHNLSFEFQFIRNWFYWEKVFAINDRNPVYALTLDGIEFRCSYILSGYGLASLGTQLQKYPVEKMVGDLDYSLNRHSDTPLTDKELKYCENDVRVVMSYIQERIESDGNITRIPLTKTGYVRKYCRDACMYSGSHKKNPYKFLNYNKLMKKLVLDADEYQQLKRAFQGGFTHANAFYSGKIMHNVGSYDFTSSYPAVMVSEQFPMSKAEVVKIKDNNDFLHNLNLYCCLFDCEFVGIESTTMFEHPISKSRCWKSVGVVEDNGRIVEAETIRTTLTEQDFFTIRKFYKWKSLKIGTFRRYQRGYLPTDFVKAILKLYEDKTTLKGVVGREEDYLRSKELINSCYGMTVTDICRDEITYNGIVWNKSPVDIEKTVEQNNRSKKRFLFFPWGVWVTAYARKNLFTGIYEFGNDYIYSDTDSVKAKNIEKHQQYIEEYNKRIVAKLERAMDYHKLPHELIRPKTIKGVEKILGVWDFEGVYTRFKTLGAKRYMVEKNDALIIDKDKPSEKHYNVSLTVSGVNKTYAIPYLLEKYGVNGVFEHFTDELVIPAEFTGKMTHTYIDDEISGVLTDYTGVQKEYHELSGVHLEPAEYSLSLADAYIDFLMGIQDYNK